MFWLRNKKIKFSLHTLNESPEFSFIAIETYFITERKKKLSTTKEPGGSNVKPESVAVTMDGEQNVPNATESDNLMNESHTTEKEVTASEVQQPFVFGKP